MPQRPMTLWLLTMTRTYLINAFAFPAMPKPFAMHFSVGRAAVPAMLSFSVGRAAVPAMPRKK
jgi:hypothetical protein